jgi:sugar/nucleoside kinase (ribokinase family)
MKDIDVIGLGVSTIDILNVVDHFPSEEEVQKAIETAIDGGGPVATAIVTLARLGAKVMMIDSIGNDWRGKLIIDEFKKENVLTNFIKVNKGCTSSTAAILVRKNDGARTIIYSPGNAPEVSEKEITPELISRAKYIHINGRHLNACLHVCKIAKVYGTKISFDGGSHRFNNELKNIIPLTNVCILAKDFAFNYSNKTSINDAAEEIVNSGPEIVVITDGLNGSWLFTKEIKGYHQKAFVMPDTIDTTGCGDSFHGAFLSGLCKGYDLLECMKIASIVAAINATKLGGRAGLPTFDELHKFINENNMEK